MQKTNSLNSHARKRNSNVAGTAQNLNKNIIVSRMPYSDYSNKVLNDLFSDNPSSADNNKKYSPYSNNKIVNGPQRMYIVGEHNNKAPTSGFSR